jgi:hypothetical protein
VLIFVSIIDEEENASGWEAIDQQVQKQLRFVIDPMEILKHKQQGLNAALGQQQASEGVERPLPALTRVTRMPSGVLDTDLEERKEGSEARFEGAIQRHELSGDLLTDVPLIVAISDFEIRLEQIKDRQIWRHSSVGDAATLENDPTGSVHVYKLEEEPGFSNACLADDCD